MVVTLAWHQYIYSQYRTGQLHARIAGHTRKQLFIKTRARAFDDRIGFAVDLPECRTELIQRRAVDQAHRIAERDTDGDRQHLYSGAQPVSPGVSEDQLPPDPQHLSWPPGLADTDGRD